MTSTALRTVQVKITGEVTIWKKPKLTLEHISFPQIRLILKTRPQTMKFLDLGSSQFWLVDLFSCMLMVILNPDYIWMQDALGFGWAEVVREVFAYVLRESKQDYIINYAPLGEEKDSRNSFLIVNKLIF